MKTEPFVFMLFVRLLHENCMLHVFGSWMKAILICDVLFSFF
jgi:hypothetical protein